MDTASDRLVDDYLKRLRRELRDLPRDRRNEVLRDIEGHIAEARAELPSESEDQIRAMLDRLGDPAVIADDAWERYGLSRGATGTREVAAIVLLLLGGFVFLAGWIFGLILLWSSKAWTTTDKLIGTLLIPGGLAASAFVAFGLAFAPTINDTACTGSAVVSVNGIAVPHSTQPAAQTCSSSGGSGGLLHLLIVVLVSALLLSPLATTVYLSLRLRSRRGREQWAPPQIGSSVSI